MALWSAASQYERDCAGRPDRVMNAIITVQRILHLEMGLMVSGFPNMNAIALEDQTG